PRKIGLGSLGLLLRFPALVEPRLDRVQPSVDFLDVLTRRKRERVANLADHLVPRSAQLLRNMLQLRGSLPDPLLQRRLPHFDSPLAGALTQRVSRRLTPRVR